MKSTILPVIGLLLLCGCQTAERKSVILPSQSVVVPGAMRLNTLTASPQFEPNSTPAEALQNHWLPDPRLTPGAVFKRANAQEVCVPGYTKQVRDVPPAVRKAVYQAYGMSPNAAPCPCELDHLISLELGGSNDPHNLWPQPYTGQWNAHEKDKLENFLHKQVCEGKLTLQQAQQKIAGNWIQAYLEYGLNKQ